ncbi:MAG: DUF4340 domain-containing protein [Lachnotalea sp.]
MTKKSKIKKLITLVILLIAVLATYFVVGKINKEKQEKELIESSSEDADTITINSIDTDTIVSFSYTYNDIAYEFYKENDTWYCSNDTSQELDQDKLGELVANFSNVTASRLVEDSATDLGQYGLDNPTNVISVTDRDGNTTVYNIGNLNETVNGYYVSSNGNNTVFLVSSFPTAFAKSLDDLIKTEDTTSDETTDTTTKAATDTTSETTTDTTQN